MPAPELVAYPALLLAIYGLYRVGRRTVPRMDGFEWARACSLAILVGVLVVVEIHLVRVGSIASTIRLFAAALGVAGCAALVGLTTYEALANARRSHEGSSRSPAPA